MSDTQELFGELQMLEAMYADSISIAGTSLLNLSRQTSNNSSACFSPAAASSSEASHQQQQPASTVQDLQELVEAQQLQQEAGENDDDLDDHDSNFISHIVIVLVLRKNVQIEFTTPARGYYGLALPAPRSAVADVSSSPLSSSFSSTSVSSPSPSAAASSSIRLRFAILHCPIAVDRHRLEAELRSLIAAHAVGDGALIVSAAQAAENFVETCVQQQEADAAARVNSSEDDELAEEQGEDDETLYGGDGDETVASAVGGGAGGMVMQRSSNSSWSRAGSFDAVSNYTAAASVAPVRYVVGSASGSAAAGTGAAAASSTTRIIHRLSDGLAISDKKSKFIAHAAPVTCEADVAAVVATLRAIPAIAAACHPSIWAYRLRKSSNNANNINSVLAYDCDDDGEHGGARSIMFVLEQQNIEGWVVVVTRYFGGTLLGPVRFKHIATVTRAVLDEVGAIQQANNAAAAGGAGGAGGPGGASPKKKRK